jgi:hypothetical protein
MSTDGQQLIGGFTIKELLKRTPTLEELSELDLCETDPLYYCMDIGEDLKEQRYHVVRKLGWGGHASVWLAHDRTSVKSFVCKKIHKQSSDPH